VLSIRKSERKDTGKYKLTLTNDSGSCKTFADGVVLGRPSMPQGPIEITDVRAKKAKVSWKKPTDDGGSPVSYYMVEKMDIDTGRWIPCGETGPEEQELLVDGLTPNKKYKFRVKAVNKEGESEPLESTEPVVAKNPYTVPNPPQNVEIEDWDNVSVSLRWQTPSSDGGRPITHYLVEQKGKYDIDFQEVYQTSEPVSEAKVENLKEGQIYEFRVRAVNKAGKSEPGEPTPKHLCKHRNCE
jgi:predicted phage tail protein